MNFGSRIDRTRRLVQNQNFRICDKCPGNRQQLPLPLGNVGGFFIQNRIVPIRQLAHKIINMRCFGCGKHFIIRGIFATVFQIIPNRAGKQPGILKHHGKMRPNIFPFHVTGIRPIQPD